MKGLMGGVPLNPFDAHSDLSECLLRVSAERSARARRRRAKHRNSRRETAGWDRFDCQEVFVPVRNAECGMRNVNVQCGMRNVECGMWNAEI